MNLEYSIFIQLITENNKENFINLLQYGSSKLSFEYYVIDHKINQFYHMPLTSEQAIDYMMVKEKSTNQYRPIIIKKEDTYISLNFFDKEYYLTLLFSDFTKQSISPDTDQDADLKKYIELILEFTGNYQIINLKVSKE